MMRFHSGIAAMLVVIATSSGVRADDVTDQINEALKAYRTTTRRLRSRHSMAPPTCCARRAPRA